MIAKRILILAALSLSLVVALGLGSALWVLGTDSGTAWLLQRVESRFASQLSIGASAGTLWDGVVLDDVQLLTNADEVAVSRVELEWNLPAVFNGIIELEEVAVSDLTFRRGSAAPGAASADAVVFPMRLVVNQGSIARLLVSSVDNELEFSSVSYSLDLSGNQLSLDNVGATIANIALQGSGTLQLGIDQILASDISWSTEIAGLAYSGRGLIDGALPTLRLSHELSSPVAATAIGEIYFENGPEVDLEVAWSDFAWPGVDRFDSPAGEMRVTGWLDDYQFEGAGEMRLDGTSVDLSVSGSGTPSSLLFDTLALANESGEIVASGDVTIDPLTWALEVQSQNLNPSLWLEDWPGALQVSGTFGGQLEPLFEWILADISLDGTLREQPVSGNGALSFRSPDVWELDALSLFLSGNQITLDGRFGQELGLDVLVNAPALGSIWPEASGELRVDGRISGTRETPELRGRLEGQSLTYDGRSAETLLLAGQADLIENGPAEVELQAAGVTWSNVTASSVTGHLSGSSSDHLVSLNIHSNLGEGRLTADGGWAQGSWAGTIDTLTLDQASLGIWELTEPTALSLGSGNFEIQSTCVQQMQSRVCGSARIGTLDDRIETTFTDFELGNVQAFLPPDLSVRGLYNGAVTIDDPLLRREGTVTVTGTSTVIGLLEDDELALEVPVLQFDLDAQLAGDQVSVEATMQGEREASVSVHADITEFWSDTPNLDAEIDGQWSDLGILSLLSPDVSDVAGTANMSLEIIGPLWSPSIQGLAAWENGQITVPRWGFSLEGIDAQASSPGGSIIGFTASGTAGEGEVMLEGTADLGAESWPMQFSIHGENLHAVQTPDADVYLSPDLDIDVELPNVGITGSLLIPNARLVLDEVPAQAVTPSADAVVHGVAVTPPPRPLSVQADLDVLLGEDVSYTGAGLNVALTGGLGLTYDSGRSAVATGAVTLLGNYEAYGQTLELDRGQLLFAGPIDNPGLDVRAVRRVGAITAGVQLAGTVKAPTSQIFSSPAMSEADALAYLLFGRPLSDSGDGETASLEGAALSMGLRQALPAIQRIGQTVGLDELTVQATAADTGEIMAGKQISPRIYLRYSYGLFNRLGGLLVRFRLSDRFSLETRSGDYKSMDLMYTVERD